MCSIHHLGTKGPVNRFYQCFERVFNGIYGIFMWQRKKPRDIVYMTESGFKTISQKIKTVIQNRKGQFNRK